MIVPGVCPLDCPDACSLDVHVEDGRVTALDGNRRNPVTGGFICAKVRRFPEAMYGEDRLLRPAVRSGRKGEGRFRRVSWDEALDRVARELARIRDQWGGEAILPVSYGGSNGLLSQDTTDARLFRRLGASTLQRTVCAAPSGRAWAGLYGKMPGVGYPDFVHARLIVIWGANPVVSGIHLMPYLQEARNRGAKLVVIDPRRTKLAWKADLHIAPQPGSDLALALAVIRWLFDNGHADTKFLADHTVDVDRLRGIVAPWNVHYAANVCRITAREVEDFARLYADSQPALIRLGWGLERNRNGGSAAAAVLALPAVAGKFGVRGGGYAGSSSSAWKELRAERAAKAEPPPTRRINMNRLGAALTGELDPPVRALFVYNANPLTALPDQQTVRNGLLREDLFTVVFDPFFTDTARYADVILPAAAFLERNELVKSYGSYALQYARAAVTPAGEARSNHEVFLDLVRRLHLDRPGDPESESEVLEAIFAAHPRGSALLEELMATGIVHPPFGSSPVQFVDVFPGTADGKIHLVPEELDREAPHGLYGFQYDPADRRHPLALISPASRRTLNSTLGGLHPDQVALRMHPGDALVRRIQDGDPVRVFNDRGEVRCRVKIDSDIRVGVVMLPKGLWLHNTENQATANALVPDTVTDLGGGACFNDARVEVERLRPLSE